MKVRERESKRGNETGGAAVTLRRGDIAMVFGISGIEFQSLKVVGIGLCWDTGVVEMSRECRRWMVPSIFVK